MKCIICGRLEDTRFGFCFDCAECENVIKNGKNMYDEVVAETSRDKLKYILNKFGVTK